MKRTKGLIFSLLFLLPILILSGCGSTNYFSIMAKTGNLDLGRVTGGSVNPFSEGTEVKLVATPINGATFLCWIKDGKKVYSTSEVTRVTASASTAGNYTALFEDPKAGNIVNMMYVGLTEIEYEGQDFSKIDYTIKYSISTNREEYTTLDKGTMTEATKASFNGSVFCLLENSSFPSFLFNITLTITNPEGTGSNTITLMNESNDLQLSNSNFDTKGEATLSKDGLTLKFSKLNSAMFATEE